MKKVLSLVMALVLVFGMATTSFADNLDLTNIVDNSKSYSWSEFVKVPTNTIYVGNNIDDYVIEYNNEFYSAKDLDEATKDGTSLIDAIAGLEPVDAPEVPEEPTGDLEVVEVSAIDTTKVVTVKATAPNAEEEATADVAIFAYDEEGERGETAVATAADVEIVEGAIEVEFETLETGSYVAVVTVGEEEAELDFAVDFDAADAAVKAVNTAKNQIELKKALENEFFVEHFDATLLAKYVLGTDNNTVAEIQEKMKEVNATEENNALLEDIKDAVEDNDQIKLLELLKKADLKIKVDEEDVAIEIQDDIIHLYQEKLAEGTIGDLNFVSIAAKVNEVNEEPIVAINTMVVKTNSDHTNITTLETWADRLGLDLTEFDKLVPNRGVAAINDLIQNKPEEGYTVETLKPIFDEIVATRLVFEESVKLFASASSDEPLKDLTYITMLIDQLESVSYEKHSNNVIKGEDGLIADLQDLVDRFDALKGEKVTLDDDAEAIDAQKAVLKTIVYEDTRSSTITRNALDTALTAVENLVAPEKVREEYKAVAKVAEALGLKDTEGAFLVAKNAVEALSGESADLDAAKAAIKALEQIIDLNQAIKDKDASAVEKVLLALDENYADDKLYADLAKVNRVELAEELIEATEDLIVDANSIKLSETYTAYDDKIKAVNDAKTNSTMKAALEVIVGEDKVTLEQAEEFINAFPVDKDGERVPYTTLADIIAAIK